MRKLAQAIRSRNYRLAADDGIRAGRICLELLREAVKRSGKLNLPAMAGNLAFTTVLSIAPLIAVLFYVFKIIGGLEYAYDKLMPFILTNLSEGTGEVVEQHLAGFIRQVHAKAVGWAGIAGLLITSLLTYSNIVLSFNRIWEIERPRSIQHRAIRAMTLLVLGPLLVTASLAITTAIAAHVKAMPHSTTLLAVLLNGMLFFLLYSLVPMVKVPKKVIALGAILPAMLWELAKVGYALYTKRIVTYSAFYGSFAAIPLFLLWIYIGWCITLFGGVWVRTLQLHFERNRRRL